MSQLRVSNNIGEHSDVIRLNSAPASSVFGSFRIASFPLQCPHIIIAFGVGQRSSARSDEANY